MFIPLKITSLLEEKGTSKVSLQKYTGLSKGGLYNILNGVSSPTAENLEKIADFFGVTIDYFFDRSGTIMEFHEDTDSSMDIISEPLIKGLEKEIEHLKELLEAKEETLDAKEETLQEMRRNIRDKEEIIILLKRK